MASLHGMYVSGANCTFENIDLADNETRQSIASKTPTTTLPFLETEEGNLSETNAILFYFAQKYKKDLLGQNSFETAKINQWIEYASCELNRCQKAIIYPMFGWNEFCKESFDKENAKIKDYLKIVEKELEGKNYLVGNRLTLADIVLFRYLRLFMMFQFPEGMRKKLFPNTTKWFENIMKTNETVKAYGRIVLCKIPLKPFMQKIEKKELIVHPKLTPKIKAMDTKNPTMKNIQLYITNFIQNRSEELFKDFLPPNYTPLVQKNNIGDSEFTTPCATQIFSMCNKKKDWKYSSIEELAQAFVKDLKDENNILSEFKVVVLEPIKKDDKKEKEGKKKKKQMPRNVFIDIYINPEWAEEEAINILKKGISLDTKYKNHHIAVDFSSPNIAKEMHVGHLRSAIIGESVKRIMRCAGDKVIGDVHFGDWGTPIGMLIAELQSEQPDLPYFKKPFKSADFDISISEISALYRRAAANFKESDDFKEKARIATFELQNKRAGYIALWQLFHDKSVAAVKENYDHLGVDFDLWNGESDVNDILPKLVVDLENKKMAIPSQGALIVPLEAKNNHERAPLILKKSDGAYTYAATDLATLIQRVNDYHPDNILYVVDARQREHFDQVFEVARLAGIVPESTALEYIPFGTVNGTDGKPFKTRSGGVMTLKALIELAVDKARETLPADAEKTVAENQAHKVALGALKFQDLKNARTSDYIFDTDNFTKSEGKTGAYLQYAVARINSILDKSGVALDDIERSEIKISHPL